MDYLVLRNRKSHFNVGRWSPYAMKRVIGNKLTNSNGIMYYHDEQVIPHLVGELWSFTDCTPDETIDEGRWRFTRAGMITERYDGWNPDSARLFANDCARLAVDKYTDGEARAMLHGCLDTALDYLDGYCRIPDVDEKVETARYVMYGPPRESQGWHAGHSVVCAMQSLSPMRGEYASAVNAACFAADAALAAGGKEEEAAMLKEQHALLRRYAMGESGPFVGQ